jgi:PPK2 family polyphosphate:nucleotide phosphotransferase
MPAQPPKKAYIPLAEQPTRAPKAANKEKTKLKVQELCLELGELQDLLFAEGKHGVLVVLQGLDAAGKGGVVRNVFSAVNPAGCRVKNFQKPTPEELQHDFLWRIHRHIPPRGIIQLFDRSHYEDILVPLAEGWIDEATARRRLRQILTFEEVLRDAGTQILKFFLHVSPEEQLERLNERITNPKKRWKYDPSDIQVFQKRDAYLRHYDFILSETAKDKQAAQWHVVPADQNWYKEYTVANTLVEALNGLNMKYPDTKRAGI